MTQVVQSAALKILVTGGSGLLGTALKKFLPAADFPLRQDFGVTNLAQMEQYVAGQNFTTLLHLAAFTAVPQCEVMPLLPLQTNILGTANVVQVCQKFNLKLFYLSTDYVFSGEEGNYAENDPVLPVNKYAWSKLGGECAVRMLDNSVILRASFGPTVFPYAKAFTDQWTSRESVTVLARKIARLLKTDFRGVLHLGGPRQTVWEYAQNLQPRQAIGKITRKEVNFPAPKDTSLKTTRYQNLNLE